MHHGGGGVLGGHGSLEVARHLVRASAARVEREKKGGGRWETGGRMMGEKKREMWPADDFCPRR